MKRHLKKARCEISRSGADFQVLLCRGFQTRRCIACSADLEVGDTAVWKPALHDIFQISIIEHHLFILVGVLFTLRDARRLMTSASSAAFVSQRTRSPATCSTAIGPVWDGNEVLAGHRRRGAVRRVSDVYRRCSPFLSRTDLLLVSLIFRAWPSSSQQTADALVAADVGHRIFRGSCCRRCFGVALATCLGHPN